MSRTLPVKKVIHKRKSTRPVSLRRTVDQSLDPMVAFDLAFENPTDTVNLYVKVNGPLSEELKALGTWSGTSGEWYVVEIKRRHMQRVITNPSVVDYDCRTRVFQSSL